MEKTEMMKRFEEKTEYDAIDTQTKNVTIAYIRLLESKVKAYDRLMSGGAITRQEMANIIGKPIGCSWMHNWFIFSKIPTADKHGWLDDNLEHMPKNLSDRISEKPPYWQDSLTLPDGWEKK